MFLSYRREDSAGHTGRLHDRLSEKWGADRVFLDIDHISPGEDFVSTINRVLQECGVIVVVIGPLWLDIKDGTGRRRIDDESDFLRLEIEQALESNLRILPVLVGGARMPSHSDLPYSIKALARRNAFELTDKRFRYDASKLAEAIDALLIASNASASADGSKRALTTAPKAAHDTGPSRTDAKPHAAPKHRKPNAEPHRTILASAPEQTQSAPRTSLSSILARASSIFQNPVAKASRANSSDTTSQPRTIAVQSESPALNHAAGKKRMTYSLSELDAIGDVDPIAEASVYVSYGRHAQAEQILLEALDRNPERVEIHLGLLEIYAKQKNVLAFRKIARKVQSLTTDESEEWSVVVRLGREVDPSHALYKEPLRRPSEQRVEARKPAPGAVAAQPNPAASVRPVNRPTTALPSKPSPSGGALAVRCPDCRTVFRMVAQQLLISDGWVRCGKCSTIFDAKENIVELGKATANESISADFAPESPRALLVHPKFASDPLQRKLELAKELAELGDLERCRVLLEEVATSAEGSLQHAAKSALTKLSKLM